MVIKLQNGNGELAMRLQASMEEKDYWMQQAMRLRVEKQMAAGAAETAPAPATA